MLVSIVLLGQNSLIILHYLKRCESGRYVGRCM